VIFKGEDHFAGALSMPYCKVWYQVLGHENPLSIWTASNMSYKWRCNINDIQDPCMLYTWILP